jgi:hypothetical protein
MQFPVDHLITQWEATPMKLQFIFISVFVFVAISVFCIFCLKTQDFKISQKGTKLYMRRLRRFWLLSYGIKK